MAIKVNKPNAFYFPNKTSSLFVFFMKRPVYDVYLGQFCDFLPKLVLWGVLIVNCHTQTCYFLLLFS